MLRWPAALLLAVLLVVPTVGAFSSTRNSVHIAYDAQAAPIVVASGELAAQGALTGGFFVGGATTTALQSVPRVTLLDREGGTVSTSQWSGVTIEVSSGGLLWSFAEGALALDAAAPYGIALALPQAPVAAQRDGARSSGFLVAGEAIEGSARWSGGALELVPLDATITLRDARGQPLPEWDGRRVNAQSTSAAAQDGGGLDVAFTLEGPFVARIGGAILGGATGEGADVALRVTRAQEDRFAQTVALLEATTEELGGNGQTFAGQQGPLAMLQQMSGLLNGALLIVAGDGMSPSLPPLQARWGDADFAVGAFNVLRGDDLSLAWQDGQMRVAGEPDVALGREGFAIEPPMRVGIFPVVSVLLWAIAAGAVVWWLVQRPPKVKSELTYRLASFGAYALVLVLTLFLWDRSFTQTFGTGVLAVIRDEGLNAATLPRLGVLALIELVPWGIAAFLFALPVRIAAGVALQRLGRGKSFNGLAGASGLLALAIFGPIYALWCFNLVWSRAGSMMGG